MDPSWGTLPGAVEADLAHDQGLAVVVGTGGDPQRRGQRVPVPPEEAVVAGFLSQANR